MKYLTLLLAIQFLITLPAYAQKRKDKLYELSVGGGVVISQNNRFDNLYDKADSNPIISPFPILQGKAGPLRLRGKTLSLGLFYNKYFSPYVLITRAGERYYGPDGMDQRKDSWFFGFGARILGVRVFHNKDISARSKGRITGAAYGVPLLFKGKYMLKLSFASQYKNSVFMNYYYGVKSYEVTGSRSVYSPEGAWFHTLSPFQIYRLTKRFSITAVTAITLLPSQVKDSPTTKDKSFLLKTFIGINYSIF